MSDSKTKSHKTMATETASLFFPPSSSPHTLFDNQLTYIHSIPKPLIKPTSIPQNLNHNASINRFPQHSTRRFHLNHPMLRHALPDWLVLHRSAQITVSTSSISSFLVSETLVKAAAAVRMARAPYEEIIFDMPSRSLWRL